MRRRLLIAATALAVGGPSVAAEPAPPPRPVIAADTARSVAFRVGVVTMHNEPPDGLTVRPGGTVATERQVRELLEAAQLDRRGGVHQAPTVTAVEGQTATVRVGHTRTFTTGVEAVRRDGGVVIEERTKAVEVGTRFELTGRVAADGTTVAARVKYTDTRVAESVPGVALTVEHTGADGLRRVGVVTLAAPDVDVQTVEATVSLPAGRAVVIPGPTRMMEYAEVVETPVLSKLPYVGRLYRTVGVGRLPVRTVLVVSAVVIDEPALPVAPPPREVR